MQIESFIDWCHNQHDVVCNQKYDKTLPYSTHLKFVQAQAEKFAYLVRPTEEVVVIKAAAGHDLIEDARVTYNDVVGLVGVDVADIIYACTELRGRNRSERHGAEYFETLKQNRLAVYVKLCDIIANVTYSKLTNSSMYHKYQKEYMKLVTELYREEFEEMFDELASLLKAEYIKKQITQ